MKTLLLTLILVSMNSFAAGFDDEKPIVRQKVKKVISAVYRQKPIVAWTGDENDDLGSSRLASLAQTRANLLCQHFGYIDGSYAPDSITTMVDRTKGVIIVTDNGKLEEAECADQDCSVGAQIFKGVTVIGMFTSDRARFFTDVSCYK